MLALGSAWIGLLVAALAGLMVFYRPAFNDVMLPIVLYGAVIAIGCGGLVLMRKPVLGDSPEAAAAQSTQARVGIGLGMLAVITVYILMKFATRITRPG